MNPVKLPPGTIASITDDGKVENAVTRETLLCDFCCIPHPSWSFPADSLVLDPGLSVGAWAACETCAALIHAGSWNVLAKRSLEASPSGKLLVEMAGYDTALREIANLHQDFRRHMKGPGVRIAPVI